MKTKGRVLVAGAGFLGLELMSRAVEEGWEVVGLRREPGDAHAEDDFTWVEADLTDPASLQRAAATHGSFDWVIHCASSGRGGGAERYRAVYRDGCRHLLEVWSQARLGYTSSTSVYGQKEGEWVDETAPREPERETSEVLVETEKLVCEAGGTVLRLAGLYGHERSVLLQRFLDGEAKIERGVSRWVNQIHVADAASGWLTLMEADAGRVAGEVFNASDGSPMTQRETQEFLASHFQRPLPPEDDPDPNRKRGLTSKRVGNDKLGALGWTPRWDSFRTSVREGGVVIDPAAS